MKKIIVFLLMVTIFNSCNNNDIYRESRSFNNMGWERFDILEFNVDVEKGQLLDFDLHLTHMDTYPNDYLDVNITFNTPSGSSLSRNYHFELKDDNGNWKSVLLNGELRSELVIRKELTISKNGICKVRVENKMTKISMPEIEGIGLIVREH
jgi:gliding motility-associated lipoprotein GldH